MIGHYKYINSKRIISDRTSTNLPQSWLLYCTSEISLITPNYSNEQFSRSHSIKNPQPPEGPFRKSTRKEKKVSTHVRPTQSSSITVAVQNEKESRDQQHCTASPPLLETHDCFAADHRYCDIYTTKKASNNCSKRRSQGHTAKRYLNVRHLQ